MIGMMLLTHSLYSAAMTVDEVIVQDKNTLEFTMSSNPNMHPWVQQDAEIVLLRDIEVQHAFLHEENTKNVEIQLEYPILPSTRYSLLALAGGDGSIDFQTSEFVQWYVATNFMSMDWEDIDSIEVIDETTLMVTFRQDITSENLIFKLLEESEITEVRKNDFNLPVLTLHVEPELYPESNYILMIMDLRDVNGVVLDFDTEIFDFRTSAFEEEVYEEDSYIEDSYIDMGVYEDEYLSEEEIRAFEDDVLENEMALYAAPEEEEEEEQQGNIEEIAMAATTTPDAWAATGILILLALWMNAFFYREKLRKLCFS